MNSSMNIGEAAKAAGVSAKMIRHYEQIGLLPEAERTDAGYRQYGERDVSVLRFIRQSRSLGFSIPQIADLLCLWSDRGRASREVKDVARRHLDDLAEKMREMAEMKAALERLVASCHGSDDPHCAILAELAADSPAAPEPGRVGQQPLRKVAPARGPRTVARHDPAASTHADLMAWTRHIHVAHGSH